MTTIYDLSPVDTVSSADQIPVLVSQSGDVRKMSIALLLAYVQEGLSTSGYLQTIYSAPNATGFNVGLVPITAGGSMYLLLTPLAGYAAGTITLPSAANIADGQELLCNSTQAVTALTVAGNGALVVGAPTALTANGFFRLRYNGVLNTWYRVG